MRELTMEYVRKDSRHIHTVTLDIDQYEAAEIAEMTLKYDQGLERINIIPHDDRDCDEQPYFVAYPEGAKPVAVHADNPVGLAIMDIDDGEQVVLRIADNYLCEAFEIIDYEGDDGDFIRGIAIGDSFMPLDEFISTDSPWFAGKMKGGE